MPHLQFFGDDGIIQMGEFPENWIESLMMGWDVADLSEMNMAYDGDPVQLKNGDYDLTVKDLVVKGGVLDIVIERRYRSTSRYNSRFGYGWDMNYNIKVRKLHDVNKLVLINGENRRHEYTLDPNSDPNEPVYVSQAGLYDYIVANQDGTLTLVKKHGTEINFDINGNLSSIIDRNGNSIAFTYDNGGLLPINGPSDYFVGQDYGLIAQEYMLTKITDDLDRDINFTYDANGLLSTITDFTGRCWTYTYDPNTNDLLTVTCPNTPAYPNGLTTTYTYENHNLLTATDANGQTYLTNTYYSNDKVHQQTYGDGYYTFNYDPNNNQVTVTDRKGFDRTTVYNSSGNPISVTIDTEGLRATDPASYTTKHWYNSNMEVTKTLLPSGNYVTYGYDSMGNLLKVAAEPNNGEPNIVTTYTYDPNWNFIKTVTDPLGKITTYNYDSNNGNLLSITSPTVSTPTGDANAVVSFTYNIYGQPETVTAPDSIVTKCEYYTDANDANNFGHLWKTIVDYNETAGLNITTEYEYDRLGRAIKVTDSNDNIAQLTYNNLDQLTKATAPSPFNYVTNFSYHKTKKLKTLERPIDDSNQVTSYTYNILDKLKTVTNPLGYVTTNSYDNSENLSNIEDAEENNTHYDYDERDLLWKVTDANGNVTEYSYTHNGKLEKIKAQDGNETTYSYDGFDRLKVITYPDDTNEVFSYDKNSNLTGKKTRKDEVISFQYDALNRMTVKNGPADPNIYYRYDIAGRLYDVNDLRSVSNGGGITTYDYDRIGRVEQVNDIEGRLVDYDYDERGLRTALIYPDDSNVTYKYDSLSRLTEIRYNNSIVASYDYDELSRRKLLTLNNDTDVNVIYEYDLGNRLTKLTNNLDGASSIVFEYTSYDKVGNRKNMLVDGSEHIYNYDVLYQLTHVNYPSGAGADANYFYDSLGNRTSVYNGSTTTYTADSNGMNQYTSVGGTSFDYDKNGNLTSDGTYTYTYDAENRLIDVNDVNGNIAEYKYDFAGRRVSKTVGGATTKYCYDGDKIIAEYDGSNNLLRKFVYGPGIDEPILMINISGGNETKYFYHFDGLGSVVGLSNSSGTVVERYSYDVFGEPNRTSSLGNPYLFTGRAYDDETGNYYYRARYYKPSIGRFLQTDPIGYTAGLNLYTYCGNNPLNFIDTYGKNFFGGLVSLIAGNGFDTSYNMGWSEAGQIGKAGLQGGGQGLAAWADGVIPFANPFENYYDSSDPTLKFSQAMGHVSRDALLAAAIPNIGTWVKNPLLYEIGSKTLPTTKYLELGLKGLSAIDKGRKIIQDAGGLWLALKPVGTSAYATTILEGGTPGAWLTLEALLEGADLKWPNLFGDLFTNPEGSKK